LGQIQANNPQATLGEVFTDAVIDGAPTGFVLAQLHATDKPVLWIQDRITRRETGRPCLAGLQTISDIIHVDVSKATDVLWAMEEGLRCTDLCGVIGEIWGDPPALNFTATKRLALRAEANNVPAWLMRRAAHPNLSAARERWTINSLPSMNKPYDTQAPGQPLWQADLFRARWKTPGRWVAHYDVHTGLTLNHGITATSPTQMATKA
jgi:protein ImuA